ncbi:glycoside hydrolase family 3 N-terminal domain-containing protein [Sphingobium sp. CAP-1]|uniref:glycoside hydrolase family 3 N-terminal domain-containing protein n=1 Tax=Sphingobium sp. CAP-1 TaxID=2676077 RepID=UPI0012BB2FFE|nr:glycoside hydrolase family 3 N-terminal domain-containing protein [Sphingobium sp. CAP-1]QGP79420.1 beta-glucosidase [Sphingobium sp. CAP-1]
MKTAKAAFVTCTALLAMPLQAQTGDKAVPYKDAKAPVSERVADLLGRMTVEEKVGQLIAQSTLPRFTPNSPVTALGVVKKGVVDPVVAQRSLANGAGAFILFETSPVDAPTGVVTQNAVQSWVVNNTRLGIPMLMQAEALHGVVVKGATIFPQAIALGSTWNPALVRTMFTAVADEASAAGFHQVLAPVFDLARDPRYGRVEEMYSEDPYLVTQMGLAAVQGLQGNAPGQAWRNDGRHVIATAKHLIHGQPENGTNVGPSDYSEYTMRDVFLPPFEAAVKIGRIGSVMPSYNENLGGIPSHASSWLMKDVLRGEWGFTGFVNSDWLAVKQLHDKQFVASSYGDAGVLGFNSGLDLETPVPEGFAALPAAVQSGAVKMADLDAAVGRILTAKFNAGLFERPYADPKRAAAVVGSKANAELARKVADEAMILLKNEGALLPLDPGKVRTIAVIGPNADKARLGTYSGTPPYFVTVLDGIRKRVGPQVKVVYAEGARISEPDRSADSNRLSPFVAPSAEKDAALIGEAAVVAKSADVVILVLGGNETVSREAFEAFMPGGKPSLGDADTLELPGRQNDLVREIAKLGKPTAAVILGGRPYTALQVNESVPAVLEGWYLGQETGNAVAGALFGDVNPSGRLPVTIARNAGQLPVYYYRKPAARLGYVGSDNRPLYPFGYGLSYTSFEYGAPQLNRTTIPARGHATVKVRVTNTGKRAGDEVVQLYIHPKYSGVVQPVLKLAGFRKIRLAPGKSADVTFDIGPDQLSILGKDMKRVVEPGAVDIMIGRNAADTQKVQLVVADTDGI